MWFWLESPQGFITTCGKAVLLNKGLNLLTSPLTRDNVERLISQVPNSRHKGFSTREEAEQYYLGAKSLGKVRSVRNPGDDEVFGPRDEAVQ
jgi:hypothetical protein